MTTERYLNVPSFCLKRSENTPSYAYKVDVEQYKYFPQKVFNMASYKISKPFSLHQTIVGLTRTYLKYKGFKLFPPTSFWKKSYIPDILAFKGGRWYVFEIFLSNLNSHFTDLLDERVEIFIVKPARPFYDYAEKDKALNIGEIEMCINIYKVMKKPRSSDQLQAEGYQSSSPNHKRLRDNNFFDNNWIR